MKKLFLLILPVCLLMVSGCSSIRLKGTYPGSHFSTETDLGYEEVWNKVIDYFAMNGIPISVIDKNSGLIVSSNVDFVNTCTREVDGKPLDADAYVVIPTVRGGFGNILTPNSSSWDILGQWNVRIKDNNGKTSVSINMVKLDCIHRTRSLYGGSTEEKIPVKSTGVFENRLLQYFTE